MHISYECSHCTTEVKCKKRDFSDQAWTVLVLWNEVNKGAVDQPICDDCYNELREVLIDRADEIEVALNQANTPQKKRKKAAGRQNLKAG